MALPAPPLCVCDAPVPQEGEDDMRRAIYLVPLLVLIASASGDVVTLKSGRQVEGRIVAETGDRIILQTSARSRMAITRDKILSIEKKPYAIQRAKPPATATTPEAKPPEPAEPKPPDTQRVYVLQIVGPIESDLLVTEVSAALQAARRLKADLLLVELDTPGGRLDYTTTMCNLIEKSELKTAAYIRMGKHRGAFSAGAIISLTCGGIYMEPGTSIGSATPFQMTVFGEAKVTEKMISATSAMARGLADRHGHSPELAAAMVDPDVALRQVTVNGEVQCVPPERAAELKKQGATLGRTVSEKGKLLALTASEAHEVGLIAAVATSRDDVLKALGMEGAEIVGGRSGSAIAKRIAERDEKIGKLDTAITATRTKALAADPNRTVQRVWDGSGNFVDRGRAWRKQTDESVRAWDACLKLLRIKLDYTRKYPGLDVGEEAIKAAMIEIKEYRDKLVRERGRKGL